MRLGALSGGLPASDRANTDCRCPLLHFPPIGLSEQVLRSDLAQGRVDASMPPDLAIGLADGCHKQRRCQPFARFAAKLQVCAGSAPAAPWSGCRPTVRPPFHLGSPSADRRVDDQDSDGRSRGRQPERGQAASTPAPDRDAASVMGEDLRGVGLDTVEDIERVRGQPVPATASQRRAACSLEAVRVNGFNL